MNALLSQAADLRSQAHTLAEQALFGDLFADTSAETIAQLNAQADELEALAAPAPAVNDDVEPSPAPAPAPESLRGWYTTLTVACPLTGKIIETRETDREFTHAVAYPPCKRVKRYMVLSLHANEQAAHKSARRQGNTADGYVVLPVNDPRKPATAPLSDKPAVWGKIAPRRWGILKPAVELAPEPSPAEQLDTIFDDLLSPVSDKGLNMNLIDIKGTKGTKFYRAIVSKLNDHPSIVKATVEKNHSGDYMVKATGLSISDEEILFTLMFSNISSHGADITLTASSSLLQVNRTWDVNPWTFDVRIAADQIGMLLPTIL